MVEAVDGVRLRGLAIGRGVGHHVAAYHDGHRPAGKGLPQAAEVLGIGDVHREVLGKDVDMELVGHGHGRDAAADAVGLGPLGPGKFVDGQQHLEPPVPDGPDDALVGQGEGVEGAGEEGDGPRLLQGEAPVEQALLRHEAVYPAQHGGPVIEGQGVLGLLIAGFQELAPGQQEGPALFVLTQAAGAEHPAAQHEHGLLPGAAVAAGQALHQHAQQPLPAAAVGLRLLREPGAVGVVLLIDHAHGVQGGGRHPARGGVEGLAQVRQQLLQLFRRQPQGEPAQIIGDILGKLLLAQLQAPGQLHRHLVALVHRQPGGQGQQGVSGAVAHRHPVADLHQVGQVGGDVQHRAVLPGGVVLQQADVHLLQDPGGAGFQVVQENVGDHLLRQGAGGAALDDPAAQQVQGRGVPAVDLLQNPQGTAAAAVQPVQPVHQ